MCSQPPGLYDEPAAERGFEPLAAKNSDIVSSSPPCSSLSLSTNETAANVLPVTDKPLQGTGSLQHSAGSFRATRPRSTTRALDNCRYAGRDTEPLCRSNWERRGFDETATREQEARGTAAESRILENTRGGEATLPDQKKKRKRGSSSEGCQASNQRSKSISKKNSSRR